MPELDFSSGESPSEVLDEFWRETLSGIRNGRWGSDIRTPIYDGVRRLLTEKEISEQTIEEDLALIADSIYGEEVRMAIHDALQKIHEEGGGGTEPEPFAYSEVFPVSNGGVFEDIIDIAGQLPASMSTYYHDDNDGGTSVTSINVVMTPSLDSTAVVFVTWSDSEPSISGHSTGWQRLAQLIPTGTHLGASVFAGPVSKTGKTITFTSSTSSTRLRATARCFYNSPTPYLPISVNGLSSRSYTPASPTGSKRYYVLACVNLSSSAFSCMVSANGAAVEQNTNNGILECYPYENGDTFAPTFDFSGQNADDMVFVGVNLV